MRFFTSIVLLGCFTFNFQFSLWDSLEWLENYLVFRVDFQFSLWDSKVIFVHLNGVKVDFQFSLWDSMLHQELYPALVQTFNSLYEIRYNGGKVSLRDVTLSILFMRFNFWNFIIHKNDFSFNSLYEIQISGWSQIVCLNLLSILFMRFVINYLAVR